MDIVNREIEKPFPALEVILPKEVLSELADAAPDEMYLFHFGLGLFIRNNFLSSDSKLYCKFIDSGIHHKDDMSATIIRLFHLWRSAYCRKPIMRTGGMVAWTILKESAKSISKNYHQSIVL